jgi:hypothetical protein
MSRCAAAMLVLAILSGCRFLALGPPPSAPRAIPTAPPITLPDPLGGTAHAAGEAVAVGNATVTYLGTVVGSEGFVSWLTVHGNLPDGVVLVSPDGEIVDLHADGAQLRSDAWAAAVSPAGHELTLAIDGQLIAFTVGPVAEGDGPSPSLEVPPPIR